MVTEAMCMVPETLKGGWMVVNSICKGSYLYNIDTSLF